MFRLKEGKISSHGLFNILVILVVSNVFLGIPRTFTEEGGSAAWLLMLMAGLVAAIGVFIVVRLLKKYPAKNIVEIAEVLWGRPGSIMVALVVTFVALYTATVTLREFAETMLTTVLPRTPISVISFFFIAVMIIGAYNGLEVITRTTSLLFPFIFGGIFSILLLSMNFVHLNNLFPVLGPGLGELVFHAPGRSSVFIEIFLVTVIASNITDWEKVPWQTWKAFLTSLVIYVVVELFYISVLHIYAAEKVYVPLFQMARIIYMGRFVQRIEAIYIFVWFFTGALKLTLSLYAGVTVFSRGFKIPIYQPLVFPLSLLVFSLSFLPRGIFTAIHLDMGILREYGAIFAWGLPLALLTTSLLKKRGGGQPAKQKTR